MGFLVVNFPVTWACRQLANGPFLAATLSFMENLNLKEGTLMKLSRVISSIGVLVLVLVGCGKAKEVTNSFELKGHWLMTDFEQAGRVEKATDRDSLVLTFKDGKAAFSPTDSARGRALYRAVHRCTLGPRPYRTDRNDIVFDAVLDCSEKRIAVTKIDVDHLKLADPDNPNIVRSFVRLGEDRFLQLVAQPDRHL